MVVALSEVRMLQYPQAVRLWAKVNVAWEHKGIYLIKQRRPTLRTFPGPGQDQTQPQAPVRLHRQIKDSAKMPFPDKASFLASGLTSLAESDANEDCPIDQRPPRRPVRTLCKHLFCRECLMKWLEKHNTCPLCRSELFKTVSRAVACHEHDDDDSPDNTWEAMVMSHYGGRWPA